MAFTQDALFYLNSSMYLIPANPAYLSHMSIFLVPQETRITEGREMGIVHVIWEVINRPFCSDMSVQCIPG